MLCLDEDQLSGKDGLSLGSRQWGPARLEALRRACAESLGWTLDEASDDQTIVR